MAEGGTVIGLVGEAFTSARLLDLIQEHGREKHFVWLLTGKQQGLQDWERRLQAAYGQLTAAASSLDYPLLAASVLPICRAMQNERLRNMEAIITDGTPESVTWSQWLQQAAGVQMATSVQDASNPRLSGAELAAYTTQAEAQLSHIVTSTSVCLGGTFDHLHFAHKIMLTLACLRACSTVYCGVSGPALLVNKKHAACLESLETRCVLQCLMRCVVKELKFGSHEIIVSSTCLTHSMNGVRTFLQLAAPRLKVELLGPLKMASSGRRVPSQSIKPLDRRVPRNPKFDHVKSKTDSGASLNKAKERADYISTRFKYRPDEIFRRIKVNTFVQLMLEVADQDGLSGLEEDQLDEAATMADPGAGAPWAGAGATYGAGSVATNYSTASSFASFATGIGERDTQPKMQRAPVDTSSPYLLVDVRDVDDYAKCHILSAHTTDNCVYTSRMGRAATCDQEGRIIVVYDEDETLSCHAATVLVQRGVENLFMLSGGLRVLIEKYPDGMVVGEVPPHLRLKGHAHAAVPVAAPLTMDNLEVVRSRLESNLLQDDASSTASSTRSSRAPSRTATPRTGGGVGARTMGASKPGTARSTATAASRTWR
ncbi:uncharacterized protein MONBRDRAFT_36377 [Monosiga brevicollis MX1]|uniref:Rhodanese domain-containing protein n=1 Tax=Monosiga brevicollis TaxID=81824 RepID=A9UV95_MONBE|nr:uncharacterized protein MONBRDRAFT_36377 [Monosiga brevicollis MX1]EDQ91042.1 predicted protein [Monosiga brevicollis MX1]|eukprot:XP_001744339.1 hypothetical protein [Monosiga brevicollis MX1]